MSGVRTFVIVVVRMSVQAYDESVGRLGAEDACGERPGAVLAVGPGRERGRRVHAEDEGGSEYGTGSEKPW
nr:hypothetical protein [Micromonospora sp. CP22]